MASKVEQQYKLLNAELMDQVQKQRIEIGAYRSQVIALKHENMELREASILSNARRRQDHIGILRTLMRRLEIDSDCLADKTLTAEQEPEPELASPSAPTVVKRRSQQRRSSKKICQELRRSSELICSINTISPTRHRDTKVDEPKEAPRLTHTPPPKRIGEMTDDISSEDEIINVTSIDEEEQPFIETVQEQLAGQKEQEPPAEKTLQGPPAEELEQQLSSEEEEQSQSQEISSEEEENSHSDDRLFSILEDSDEETTESSYSFSSPISCDSTFEEFAVPRRPPLRSVDQNVLPVTGTTIITRGMSKSFSMENSIGDQPSIQVPRLMVTRPSLSPCKSLLNSLASTSKLSPRCSRFEGDFQMSGSNTSTPKANQPPKKVATELGESTTRYVKPRERARKQTSEPRESEQTADLSTSMCLSSTGRPSRKCRPTQLAEPSLKDKMRNASVGKKRI